MICDKIKDRSQAISYEGPTRLAIRSGKHFSSTASTHSEDFKKILNLEEFFNYFRSPSDADIIKLVVVITSNSSPNENPRYEQVISEAIDHFLKFDLDAIFLATNAPGHSAYNRAEKRWLI